MCDDTELTQAGFNAISNAIRQLYPGQQGLYYGTIIPAFLGGNDPLDGVEVWKSESGIPHWHYVTYGFTELFDKESDDPNESGYGFELTFRLKRETEEQPPVWPVNLLQNLARYVFSSGNVFGPGHHMNANGPIALETDTRLTAMGFRTDPELGELNTPNGHMSFLQVVGITEDEMDAMMCWDGKKFLHALSERLPLCVTDLSRTSMMDNAAFHKVWQEGMERDGSSTGFLYMDELGVRLESGHVSLRLGAGHTQVLLRMLQARVGKGRSLLLQGSEHAVLFQPGQQAAVGMEDSTTTLTLPENTLRELQTIVRPHAGTYPLTSFPMAVELVPTKITDCNGNVIKVVE